jgi:hypothetical protein
MWESSCVLSSEGWQEGYDTAKLTKMKRHFMQVQDVYKTEGIMLYIQADTHGESLLLSGNRGQENKKL